MLFTVMALGCGINADREGKKHEMEIIVPNGPEMSRKGRAGQGTKYCSCTVQVPLTWIRVIYWQDVGGKVELYSREHGKGGSIKSKQRPIF